MYKAKVTKINSNDTYKVFIPSLGFEIEDAYAIVGKGFYPKYEEGDLVLVSETNDESWVILGYVYGQN